MYGLVIEERQLNNKLLSRDLAELLFEYVRYGKIVVATDKPTVLHSTIRRRWQYLVRRLQVDRSRTLNYVEIDDINRRLYFAQHVRFSSKPPEDDLLDAGITFMKASDCVRVAAGQILGITVRDHLIVTNVDYYSFRRSGLLLN